MSFGSMAARTMALGAAPSRRPGPAGGSAQRYIPKARVQPSAVTAINLLVPASGTLSTLVEGMPASLTIDPMLAAGASDASGTAGGPPAFELIWLIGAEDRISVTLPEEIVAHVARAIEPRLGTVPDDPTR